MIIAIIMLLMTGSFDNIIYSMNLSEFDCANTAEYNKYNFATFVECEQYVTAAKVQFMSYVASNMLTSADIFAYLAIAKKAINPFILRNKNIVVILGEKLEMALANNVPIFIHKGNAYFARQWYKDEVHNNHMQIYVAGINQPLGYKNKLSVPMMINYNEYLFNKSKTRNISSYNIFKLGHFKRNWVLEINPVTYTFRVKNVKKLDPSLPYFRFGIWKKLQIIVPEEAQVTENASYSISSALIQQVKINVKELNLEDSSLYVYSLLKNIIKDAKEQSMLFKPFDIKWLIIAILGIGMIFLMFMISNGVH